MTGSIAALVLLRPRITRYVPGRVRTGITTIGHDHLPSFDSLTDSRFLNTRPKKAARSPEFLSSPKMTQSVSF